MANKYNIVILNEKNENYSPNEKIIESIEKKGHTWEILRPSHLINYVSIV